MPPTLPIPSCPIALLPQHQSDPSIRIAQECCKPPVIARSHVSAPTVVNMERFMVSPRPSCPVSFSPAHESTPADEIAQL